LRPFFPPLLRENLVFRRFWLAQTISLFGDQISLIAIPLAAVLVLDANAAQMGYLVAAELTPNLDGRDLCFGDRWQSRKALDSMTTTISPRTQGLDPLRKSPALSSLLFGLSSATKGASSPPERSGSSRQARFAQARFSGTWTGFRARCTARTAITRCTSSSTTGPLPP